MICAPIFALVVLPVLSLVIIFLSYRATSVTAGAESVPPKLESYTELWQVSLDNLDGLITRANVHFDEDISFDDNGSVRIEVDGPETVRLFETGDIDIEKAWLNYQAKVKTENVKGQVYLEMWCCFNGAEYFSRGLNNTLSGTTAEWVLLHTPFMLREGENPDNIKLNLVVDGSGTVWIDEMKLLKAELN